MSIKPKNFLFLSIFFSFLLIGTEAMSRTITITKAQGCTGSKAISAFRAKANRLCGGAGVKSFKFNGARVSRNIKSCGRAGRWVEFTGNARAVCGSGGGGFKNAKWIYSHYDTSGCKRCRVKIGYSTKGSCPRKLGACNNNRRGRYGSCKAPGTTNNDFVFVCK